MNWKLKFQVWDLMKLVNLCNSRCFALLERCCGSSFSDRRVSVFVGWRVVSCVCWCSTGQLKAALFCCNVDCCFQILPLIFAHCQSPVNETANIAGKEGVKVQRETLQTLLAWGDQDLHSALQLLNKPRAVSGRSQYTFLLFSSSIEKLIITLLTIGIESFCDHRRGSGFKGQLGFGLVCERSESREQTSWHGQCAHWGTWKRVCSKLSLLLFEAPLKLKLLWKNMMEASLFFFHLVLLGKFVCLNHNRMELCNSVLFVNGCIGFKKWFLVLCDNTWAWQFSGRCSCLLGGRKEKAM